MQARFIALVQCQVETPRIEPSLKSNTIGVAAASVRLVDAYET